MKKLSALRLLNAVLMIALILAVVWGCKQADPEPVPIAEFSYAPTQNLEAPVTITFRNESQYATSYEWNFDDGTTSLQSSPTHTFTQGGTFIVKLTAKGPGGTDQTSVILYITENPYGGNNGKAGFWTAINNEGNTTITLKNGSSQTLKFYWNSAPGCDNVNVPNFVLAPGTYEYTALNESGRRWNGTTTITRAKCSLIELKKADGTISLPSGAVIRSTLISRSGETVRFTLDIAVTDFDNTLSTNLNRANFTIPSASGSGIDYSFTNDGTQSVAGGSAVAYSAALLLDQSGSIRDTDPGNTRIDAAKLFCNSLGSNDNIYLSAFAGGGSLPFDLTYYGSGFTSNGSSYNSTLDALRNLIGGGTPLYKSTYSMIDYTAQKGTNANKAVVVFTDGDDTDPSRTVNDVIQRAKQQNVKVFMVGLKQANVPSLAYIANQTGGAFMFAQDAPQLMTMFGTLGKLLNGTANYYRTTWTMTRKPGVPNGGSYYVWSSVQVKIGNRTIYVPFRVDY
jgi:PKD repeat protein